MSRARGSDLFPKPFSPQCPSAADTKAREKVGTFFLKFWRMFMCPGQGSSSRQSEGAAFATSPATPVVLQCRRLAAAELENSSRGAKNARNGYCTTDTPHSSAMRSGRAVCTRMCRRLYNSCFSCCIFSVCSFQADEGLPVVMPSSARESGTKKKKTRHTLALAKKNVRHSPPLALLPRPLAKGNRPRIHRRRHVGRIPRSINLPKNYP